MRDIAGWILVVLIIALAYSWSVWLKQARPVPAHSTALIQGRCAIDPGTGRVWGRILRVGVPRDGMDQYMVRTLGRPWQATHVPVKDVRVVRCEDVTGPRTADSGTRTP